jgi:hypothetical protein
LLSPETPEKKKEKERKRKKKSISKEKESNKSCEFTSHLLHNVGWNHAGHLLHVHLSSSLAERLHFFDHLGEHFVLVEQLRHFPR